MIPGNPVLSASFFFLFLVFSAPVDAAPQVTREQLFQFGTLAARDGQPEQAIALFQKILDVDPQFAPAYNSIGLVHQAMGGEEHAAEAEHYFRLALSVDPKFVECWNNLARQLYGEGKFSGAEKALAASLALAPDQPGVRLLLGWVYLIGFSRVDEAAAAFHQGLSAQADAGGFYGLGLCRLIQEDRPGVIDAITSLRRVGREDQALRLEAMLRSGVRISSRPGTPLVMGGEQGASLFEREKAAMGDVGEDGQGGIKVRLKGPLNP